MHLQDRDNHLAYECLVVFMDAVARNGIPDQFLESLVEIRVSELVTAHLPQVSWSRGLRCRCRSGGHKTVLASWLMRHVIWDWNGTLADDLPTVVRCVNLSLDAIGEDPILADDYRNHYTRPVRTFYDRLLGRHLTDLEWATIDEVFHVAYAKAAGLVPLAHDARSAIDLVADSEATQSILSMWWHDDLITQVNRHGLADLMVRVDGNTKDAGETKERLLDIHMRAIGNNRAVLIGDAVDDALAAKRIGIDCIVYDGGSHHRDELEELGEPIAASLLEAAGMAVARS